jgi:hypothetical protein
MIKRTLGCLVLCGWLAASGSLQAHHSLSGAYDIRKEGEVSGALTQIKLTNPHGSLTLAVKNPDGSTTEWVMTTGAATTLAQLGIGKSGPNALKPGDVISVKFYPTRNGSPLGFIKSIIMPDGHVVQVARGDGRD